MLKKCLLRAALNYYPLDRDERLATGLNRFAIDKRRKIGVYAKFMAKRDP